MRIIPTRYMIPVMGNVQSRWVLARGDGKRLLNGSGVSVVVITAFWNWIEEVIGVIEVLSVY